MGLCCLGSLPSPAKDFPLWSNPKAKLEVFNRLTQAPGGMTFTPDGSTILSLHQFQGAGVRVVEITKEGKVHSFPNAAMSSANGSSQLKLDAVLGLQSDKRGVVWMLDNGRRSEVTPKLVAWDTEDHELEKVIYLPQPATTPNSFVNDLALNPEEPYLYITDPAAGSDAALIVVDTETGFPRRVLEGHYSVTPQDVDVIIGGKPVFAKRVDGTKVQPLAGANPIACDRKGDWLYFGATDGRSLFRVRTSALHDRSLPPEELAAAVEPYANKPICDGISIDSKGNIYVSDITAKAIGIIEPRTRKYSQYIKHEDFLWPDGLCFGADDRLYFFASQMHLMPEFNDGRQDAKSPYHVFRIKPLAGGTLGR